MIPLRPGTSISQGYLNRLQARAERGNLTVAGAGMTAQDSPGGMVFAQNPGPEILADCMRMKYVGTVTGNVLLPGSLVHLIGYGGGNWDITESAVMRFDVSDYSGRAAIGILREGAAPGDCPMVQYQGIATVMVDYASVPAAWQWLDEEINSNRITRRLGTQMHTPYAQWDENGPLTMTGVGDIIPGGAVWPAGITLVTARIGVPFATQVYCYPVARTSTPGTEGGAYRCWNMGPLFNVVEVAPGDITI